MNIKVANDYVDGDVLHAQDLNTIVNAINITPGQATVEGGEVFNDYETNKAAYEMSTAFGSHTHTSANNQFVCGQNNEDDTEALFIVGCGTEQNEKNSFTVKNTGDIVLAGNVNVSKNITLSNGVRIRGSSVSPKYSDELVNKEYVDNRLSGKLVRIIVPSLPEQGMNENTIYMVPALETEEQNKYDEYMYINDKFELIGSTGVDLSDYYTTEQVDNKLEGKQEKFAEVNTNEDMVTLNSSRPIFHNVAGSMNYNTSTNFNVLASGNIGLLSDTEDYTGEIAIGYSGSPYYVGKLGIYKDTPASKFSIDGNYDNAKLTLRADYRGLNIVNSLSDVETFRDDSNLDHANIVITKNDEKIYMHTDEIVIGKKYEKFSQGKITNLATPTEGTDAANKAYVDNVKVYVDEQISSLPGGQEIVLNIKNGTGTNAIQQRLDSETFTTTNENINNETEIQRDEISREIKSGAFGDYSFSIGGKSQAKGKRAFASGTSTVALGDYGHTEGNATFAKGKSSHAEGILTSALGESSHVEGNGSIAYSEAAHAEGYYTKAYGYRSHTEGEETITGIFTEKVYNITLIGQGTGDFTSGIANEPVGIDENIYIISADVGGFRYTYDNSNGFINIGAGTRFVLSKPANSQGEATLTILGDYIANTGNRAHAEGYGTQAGGLNAHAEGNEAKALGNNSHAEGNMCEAGNTGHAEGSGTKAATYRSDWIAHAEGLNTEAHGCASHAEGIDTFANGDGAHAGGIGTIAENNGQMAIGMYNDPTRDDDPKTSQLLFMIGNGASDTERHNAVEVRRNGSMMVSNSIIIGGIELTPEKLSALLELLDKQ